MKKVFKFAFMFFSIALVLLFNTGSSYAFSPQDTLSFIEGVENIDSEGVWSWDKDNCILTIHEDLIVRDNALDYMPALTFYQNSTIVLEANLTVKAEYTGIACDTLNITGKGDFAISTIGDNDCILADNIIINIDGDINANAKDSYGLRSDYDLSVTCNNMFVKSNFNGIGSYFGDVLIDVKEDLNVIAGEYGVNCYDDECTINMNVGGDCNIEAELSAIHSGNPKSTLQLNFGGNLNISGGISSSGDIDMTVGGDALFKHSTEGVLVENNARIHFQGDLSIIDSSYASIDIRGFVADLIVDGNANIDRILLGTIRYGDKNFNLTFNGCLDINSDSECIYSTGKVNLVVNGSSVFNSKSSDAIVATYIDFTSNDEAIIYSPMHGLIAKEYEFILPENSIELGGKGSIYINTKSSNLICIEASSVNIEDTLELVTNGIIYVKYVEDIAVSESAKVNAIVENSDFLYKKLTIHGTYSPPNNLVFWEASNMNELRFAPGALLVIENGITIDLTNYDIDYVNAAVTVKEGGHVYYPHVEGHIFMLASIQDWYVGELPSLPYVEAKYQVNSGFVGEYTGDITYSYSASLDGEFSSDIPEKAGKYYVKIEISDTTDDFGRVFAGEGVILEFNILNKYFTVTIDGKIEEFIKNSVLPTPTKEGYRFEGWIDQDGKKYTGEMLVSSDLTLTTTWSKVEETVKPEIDPEEKPEIKPEEKPEIKPEEKPEIKPEEKPEIKPEVKPEIKPQVKPEGTLNTNRPQTGDQSNIIAYTVSCLMMVSIFALLRKKQIMKK